ncbi:MAG TPA: hypothetical protein VJ810_04230 [Blastocatellia bacterium]|nr:hypothetical protein [Blastocatellia bacterium]
MTMGKMRSPSLARRSSRRLTSSRRMKSEVNELAETSRMATLAAFIAA